MVGKMNHGSGIEEERKRINTGAQQNDPEIDSSVQLKNRFIEEMRAIDRKS